MLQQLLFIAKFFNIIYWHYKEERLRAIRAALLDMTAVKIVSNSEEDSYTIFEILNARGQELAAHELLKITLCDIFNLLREEMMQK